MVAFTNLKQYEVTKDNIKEFPLVELGGDLVLNLCSSSEGNAGYMNGLLRITGQDGGKRRAKKETVIDADLMDETREHDKTLYAEHVIKGWSGVLDDEGKNVKFSVEVCKEFLSQLPNWIFDRIQIYASTPENFVVKIDSAAKAKNLAKG